ncbi:MAG: ferrous iron transporter B, partial [Phycisphaerales bacterium]|nr:ferrous iron transporter B [Phycisphaerales bacterium]
MGTETDKVASGESGVVRVEPASTERDGGSAARAGAPDRSRVWRLALVGNPNTGKTTLFNTLTGLRHRTSNFPGTTQEARLGRAQCAHEGGVQLIDLPGVYSLSLAVSESRVCRAALLGEAAPAGERAVAPDGVLLVVDATNLSRNLTLAGEVLGLGLPTVVALTMVDRAAKAGGGASVATLAAGLAAALRCPVVACDPREIRSAGGVLGVGPAATTLEIPNNREALERWAAEVAARTRETPGSGSAPGSTVREPSARAAKTASRRAGGPSRAASPPDTLAFHERHSPTTDRLDNVLMHPLAGPLAFAAVMAAVFWGVFSLATVPMDWIDAGFAWLAGAVHGVLPSGPVADLLSDGVVSGVGATVIFLPQICLLFFLIALLEDTGYLARAAFVADRLLRPFGLRGHAFVPLLSSHACALPGIMACRGIPDPKERLAAILVAPFMTCSARLPVYVLLTGILFPG